MSSARPAFRWLALLVGSVALSCGGASTENLSHNPPAAGDECCPADDAANDGSAVPSAMAGGCCPAAQDGASPDGHVVDCETLTVGDLDPAIQADLESLDLGIEGSLSEEDRLPLGLGLGRGISGAKSLKGIECFSNLEFLHLSDGEVSDLSPIAGLTLGVLEIWNNPVEDLAPISGLTRLVHLTVVGAPLSDISPLTELHALKTLNLSRTQIVDLTPLASLRPDVLRIVDTPVANIEPLAGMTSLSTLDISSTSVTDLPIRFPSGGEGGACGIIAHDMSVPLPEDTASRLFPMLCDELGWRYVGWTVRGIDGFQGCGEGCR